MAIFMIKAMFRDYPTAPNLEYVWLSALRDSNCCKKSYKIYKSLLYLLIPCIFAEYTVMISNTSLAISTFTSSSEVWPST